MAEGSERLVVGSRAPSFSATDWKGDQVRLDSFHGVKRLVLVLNRGFICPYCRMQMMRLRESYGEFEARGAEVVAIGPDSAEAFRRFWQENGIPFYGVPDPDRRVLRLYGQQVRLMRLGRLPATVVIDRHGVVRHVHYGGSMMDIGSIAELLGALDAITDDGPEPTSQEAESRSADVEPRS